jgi:hypothetical protein
MMFSDGAAQGRDANVMWKENCSEVVSEFLERG